MKNRKAFFFTMIAIVVLGLFLASFSLYEEVGERDSIQKRVKTMNSFMSSVENDLSRKLYVSTYRVIFLAENEIVEKGYYINDLDVFFKDAFIDGKVDNENALALDGYTVSEIVTDVNGFSNLVGADFNIDEQSVKIIVSQDDPWHVKTTLLLNMSLVDQAGLATMDRVNFTVSAYVPITNFEDPFYYIGTSRGASNPIIQSPYENHFSYNNITNITLHSNNSYYVANPSAPSFLKRLKGDFSSDPNGIESFVNVEYLASKDISACPSKSVVDYICFGSGTPAYFVNSTVHSWFRIDDSSGRLAFYKITV